MVSGAYWVYIQPPKEHADFLQSTNDFLEDLYSQKLLSDMAHSTKSNVDTASIDDLVNSATDAEEVEEIFVAFDLNDDTFLDASELGEGGAEKIAKIEALDGDAENDDQKLTLEEYLSSFNFDEPVDEEQQQVDDLLEQIM